MCLAEAARVLEVDGDCAVVELRGSRRRIPVIVLTADGVAVAGGDWLLVHSGLAVARISAAEAADVNAIRGESHA
jgi:hydrogenase expression/formation protein HypC